MARFTIHPPYMLNRLRANMPEQEFKDNLQMLFGEIHRFFRYLVDANDQVQQELEEIVGDGSGTLTAKQIHAKIMIRVSLDF